MSILDSLSLTAMAAVLAALVHVSGTFSLSPAPLVHAVMPEPAAFQETVATDPTMLAEQDTPPSQDAVAERR